MYKQAARTKLRFPTPMGQLAAEDLFDLPLLNSKGVCLDSIARDCDKKVKESAGTSFVVKAKVDESAQLALDIVLDVISTKLAENEAKNKAMADKQAIEKLNSLIATKQDQALVELSVEELEARKAAILAAASA